MMVPSSSGPGHLVLIQKIAGSTPAGITMKVMNTNTASSTRIESSWILGTALIALCITGFFVGTPYLLKNVSDSTCSSGWDGLGCSILTYLLGMILMSAVVLPLIAAITKYFVLSRWSDAVGCAVCVVIGAHLLVHNLATVVTALFEFFGNAENNASNVAVYIFLYILISFAVVLVFTVIVGRHKDMSGVMIALLLGIGIVAGSFGARLLAPIVTTQAHNKQSSQKLEGAGFRLYQPASVMPGYRVYTSMLHEAYADDDVPYAELAYIYGSNELQDPRPFSLYYFSTPSSYAPPKDCGYETPLSLDENRDQPCEKIGSSTLGCDIYLWLPTWTNTATAYCSENGTLITLDTSQVQNKAALSNNEIIKIYDSLHTITPSEFVKLQP